MDVFSDITLGKAANYLTAFVSKILLGFNVRKVKQNGEKLDLDGYSLVFCDDFDGTELDRTKWRPHHCDGLRKGGYWSVGETSVRDSCLHIRTEYLENGEFGSGWYTSGISTEGIFMQKYGYFECRCKLPKGEGMWSAFWLFNPTVGKVTGTGKTGTEIDIYESPYYYRKGNKKNMVTSNLHYNGYYLQTRYKNVVISALDNDPYENFNTYGLLWTEEGYTFYINGVKTAFTKYGGVSRVPEHLILSCEVDGAAALPTYGWSGKISEDKEHFTADFAVDYVKVYAKE